MMHLFVNTATNAAVKEFDCLAISRLIRTKAIFNAYTIRRFRLTRAIALAYAGRFMYESVLSHAQNDLLVR